MALGGLDGDGEDEAVAAGEAPRQTGRARGDELDLEDDLVDGGSGGGGCLPIADVVNLGREGTFIWEFTRVGEDNLKKYLR